ncbi:MAG: hypothetical protein HY209_06990 [Candidatus Omnitrophica bacterium]|nr:hypothetical protein [Candidatus Omnitrophota bacterium]
MIYLLFLLLIISQISCADIFSKTTDQTSLDEMLAKDSRNFYYRGSFDYNAYAQPEPSYDLEKQRISLGCNRYDFHESLKNLFTRPEFNSIELQTLMTQLSTSKLLVWEYSSPTLADLYKHLDTVGHLRLAIRYHQCEDLEKAVDDPIVKLRKQAVMDCMKHQKGANDTDDIDIAFKACFDHLHDAFNFEKPYENLEDPADGRFQLTGTINVTEKTLKRIDQNGENLEMVEKIIPNVYVSVNSVRIKGPDIQSRQLIAQYRTNFLSNLIEMIKEYRQNRTVNPQTLSSLSVFGVPMTEGQVKNIAMLDHTTGYLAMHKIASELAYLKTIDQYTKASEMLNRVMAHPAIEPGYKTLLKNSHDFVQEEIVALRQEKERLSQYANTMHVILDEADRQRLKTLALIKEESIGEEQKGLLKINP